MGTCASSVLLDRDRELVQLAEQAALVAAGQSRVVLVEGPAGIGKTSLVEHFADGLPADRVTVLRARCGEWERQVAFGMVRRLLGPLLADAGARAELLAGPAQPAARVLTAATDSGEVPPEEAPFAVLHGLYWLCARLARRGPLVLVVDDAHLADAASARWLRYASRRLAGHRVLFLLTRRLGEWVEWPDPLAALATDPHCVLIRPGLLSEAALARCLAETLPEPPRPELARACHQATGGNPLLLRALLRSLAEDPLGEWRLARFTGQRFAQTIRDWLAEFDQTGRDCAGALAVLGECPDPGLLARVAEVDPADCRRAGELLRQLGLVRQEPPLRWSHPLLRDIVYAQLSPRQRDQWHRRAATLLNDDGAPLEQVCAHLRQAAPAGDAWTVSMLTAAATQAIGRGAPDVAAEHLARALAEPPPVADRVAVRVRHGLASAFVDPAASIERLCAVLPEIQDQPTACRVAAVLSELLAGRGREDEAIEVLGRVAERAEPEIARVLRGRQLMMEADCSAEQRDEVLARDGRGIAGDTPGEQVTLVALAHGKALYNDSAARVAELAGRALRATPAAELANPLTCSSIAVLTWADELELAARFADEAIAGARRTHAVIGLGLHLALRARVSHFAGRLAEAAGFAAQTHELVPAELAGFQQVVELAIHGSILLDQGRVAEAADLLATHAAPTAAVQADGYFQLAKARILLSRGETRAGLDQVLALGARLREAGHDNPVMVPWRGWAVRALRTLGEREQAREVAGEALAAARRWGTARAVGSALGLLGLATGGQAGLDLLGEATRLLEGPSTPLELTAALLDTGTLRAQLGDQLSARAAFRQALVIAHRCGAGGLAATAREELIAVGGRPPARPAAGLQALSRGERRVAELAVTGYSNRRIAEELHLTLRTVETHLSTTYRKLGISGRGQLPRVGDHV
ncbi:AAA family ATPase [Crossiella sp. CA-258035]|uniref:ATP-binding protein n=1 Tax=Crossiella sp. CA-258035 TaxID=2981138 RepID=UPI0024BCBDA6|nr:LuxR family transcriptional regulator [Crossiella sp. CA-258035]WHT22814.1 AAA family ATPase [Crossiella sp. CA-258035]